MSRVRWAVLGAHGETIPTYNHEFARNRAHEIGGKVMRTTSYSPDETAARRAVIEAAERMAMRGARGDLIALIRAVGDLRAAERKEAGNG